MAEVRNNWEGRNINGVFPLRRFLGSSNHSSVFLTESSVEGFLNAAIKILPADAAHSQRQLWQWKTAATFSHPHLMRLLDCGQCEIDGEPLLFVIMEYAEESLSQILPYRALAPDEVQELLVPTLDALAFLHNENWIQGQLKPSNFLVVDDQLKLAVDTIRPVGVSQTGPRRPSIYDAPESDDGLVSAASDIWALGVTMTEALSQYPPTWLGGRTDPPTFPTNLPSEFADTIQRCLSVNAGDRPTVAELRVQTRPGEPLRQSAAQQATSSRTTAPQHTTARPTPSQASLSQPTAARPASPQSSPTRPTPAQPAQVQRTKPQPIPAQPARMQTPSPPPALTNTPQQRLAPQPSVAGPENAIPPAPAPPPQIPEPELPMRADSRPYSELAEEPKRGALVPLLFALVVVGGAIWGGTKLLGTHAGPAQSANGSSAATSEQSANGSLPAAGSDQRAARIQGDAAGESTAPGSPSSSATAGSPAGAAPTSGAMTRANTPPTAASGSSRSAPASAGASGATVHEEIPNVSASSRNTIHGHVRVAVKVTVDSSGRVIHDVLNNPSSSNYFNRVASEAARKWRFATADQGSREWLLRFEFGREGTTVKAVGPRS